MEPEPPVHHTAYSTLTRGRPEQQLCNELTVSRLAQKTPHRVFRSIYDHQWMIYENAETLGARSRCNELKAPDQRTTKCLGSVQSC